MLWVVVSSTSLTKSLISGVGPPFFKPAMVQPLLKKPKLDPDTPSNFRLFRSLSSHFYQTS